MKVLMFNHKGISLVLTEGEIQFLILVFHITGKQREFLFLKCVSVNLDV